MTAIVPTTPTDFPWEAAGIYTYRHRVDWYLTEDQPSHWHKFLTSLGCTLSQQSNGAWNASCRVLPTELIEWRHYLFLSAHNRCTGENSVHLSLELTPLPAGSPPHEALNETRRAGSMEGLLHRFRAEWPGDRAIEQTVSSYLLIYFEPARWGHKLAARKLLPTAIQHEGILLEPQAASWATPNTQYITNISAYSAQDYAPALAVWGRSHVGADESPFTKTRSDLWSELCPLLDANYP